MKLGRSRKRKSWAWESGGMLLTTWLMWLMSSMVRMSYWNLSTMRPPVVMATSSTSGPTTQHTVGRSTI